MGISGSLTGSVSVFSGEHGFHPETHQWLSPINVYYGEITYGEELVWITTNHGKYIIPWTSIQSISEENK